MFDSFDKAIEYVDRNPKVQGHLCINDDSIFDFSIENQVYGFPGRNNPTLDNMKITTWRCISSLNNIGPNDLIFLYRKGGKAAGSQEFHGLFGVKSNHGDTQILFHPEDTEHLPNFKEDQLLPFRFLHKKMLKDVYSIPNDLGKQKNKKNNNLDIIKTLSESNPDKDRLWGFRHPAVMNIGAARKSSLVAISNQQTKYLLELLNNTGIKRDIHSELTRNTKKYIIDNLPETCHKINDKFITGPHGLKKYRNKRNIGYEALLYAYIVRAFKHPNSKLHDKIIKDFSAINGDTYISKVSENCILEVVITPHIQEEIDILLCNQHETDFLIMEVKKGTINQIDVEQAEKYIQLVKQKFPNYNSVVSNVIGKNTNNIKNSENVKTVNYKISKDTRGLHLDFY